MKKRMYSKTSRDQYDVQFLHLMNDLYHVALLPSRESYLYPLMETVIYKDFKTALDGVLIEFKASANDDENPISH